MIELNEDQLDALKEFMNIAIGSAASSIATLLDAFVTLNIPEVKICNSDEFAEVLSSKAIENSNYYVSKQLFAGKFSGESMFVMQDEAANNLGNYLYGVSKPSEDDILDAVMELTNILSSTIISKLADDLGTQVQFFVPSSQHTDAKEIISYEDVKGYSKIIIISTLLDFEDQKIGGYVYILTKDEGIQKLKKLIDDKIQELYS